MNTHTHDEDNTLDASLRLQLRGLRRGIEPDRDLWPAIASRISAEPTTAAPPTRRKGPNIAPWALAASLVLSLGIAWRMQPAPAPAAAAVPVRLVDHEADAMTREYRAALQELQASSPRSSLRGPARPALQELDRSARQIREAIDRDPTATFLLDRLQRTYTLRLELTQRARS